MGEFDWRNRSGGACAVTGRGSKEIEGIFVREVESDFVGKFFKWTGVMLREMV